MQERIYLQRLCALNENPKWESEELAGIAAKEGRLRGGNACLFQGLGVFNGLIGIPNTEFGIEIRRFSV